MLLFKIMDKNCFELRESYPESPLMGRRYRANGTPVVAMNALQLEKKQEVEKKIACGTYVFEKVVCALCGGKSFQLLSEKDRYGLYSPTVICVDCGLVQINPRMNSASYSSFYNAEYRKLYGGEANPSETFFLSQLRQGERIFHFLKSYLQNFVPEKMMVLEVGCGAGGILQYFKKQGCAVKGIDLGRDYIEYGKNKYGLDLAVGSLREMELDKQPQLIIYSHVFEHILDPNAEIEVIDKCLDRDGALYVEIPSVKNIGKTYEADFLRCIQNAHPYYYSLATLCGVLKKRGFELIAGADTTGALFYRKKTQDVPAMVVSDYSVVIGYLRRMEMIRRVVPGILRNSLKWLF